MYVWGVWLVCCSATAAFSDRSLEIGPRSKCVTVARQPINITDPNRLRGRGRLTDRYRLRKVRPKSQILHTQFLRNIRCDGV